MEAGWKQEIIFKGENRIEPVWAPEAASCLCRGESVRKEGVHCRWGAGKQNGVPLETEDTPARMDLEDVMLRENNQTRKGSVDSMYMKCAEEGNPQRHRAAAHSFRGPGTGSGSHCFPGAECLPGVMGNIGTTWR